MLSKNTETGYCKRMESPQLLRHRFPSPRHAFVRLLPALAAIALVSCAPKYYSANSQNVPLFTEEGQGAVSATINPDGNRAEARAAYAVAPGLALQAGGALYFPRDEDSTGNGGSGGLFEVGVGHFRPLAGGLVLEMWGLAAYGGLENHFPSAAADNPGTSGKLNADLVRVGLQPALGYRHPWFEAAASSRLAMLNYFNVSGNLVNGDGNQQQYLRDNRLQFLLEPALTLRAGPPYLKAEAQLGFSVNLTDRDFPQDKNWASLGLVYFFDPGP